MLSYGPWVIRFLQRCMTDGQIGLLQHRSVQGFSNQQATVPTSLLSSDLLLPSFWDKEHKHSWSGCVDAGSTLAEQNLVPDGSETKDKSERAYKPKFFPKRFRGFRTYIFEVFCEVFWGVEKVWRLFTDMACLRPKSTNLSRNLGSARLVGHKEMIFQLRGQLAILKSGTTGSDHWSQQHKCAVRAMRVSTSWMSICKVLILT